MLQKKNGTNGNGNSAVTLAVRKRGVAIFGGANGARWGEVLEGLHRHA